jgi:hypothetical protein
MIQWSKCRLRTGGTPTPISTEVKIDPNGEMIIYLDTEIYLQRMIADDLTVTLQRKKETTCNNVPWTIKADYKGTLSKKAIDMS